MKAQVSSSTSVPAPIRGLNAKDSVADMGEDWALELDNFFPNLTSVDLRSGYASHSTGNNSSDVQTLVEYSGPVTHKLISAAGGSIYDASASGAATSIASGKSNNKWQTTMFGTGAGNYLYMVNGQDAPIHYNGSAFATPTLSGVTATDIIGVAAHQKRLFFTFANSLVFGYLPVASISGTVSEFDLGGLCKLGGHLMAIGSWTRDGGSGPDDIWCGLTSEGECILFSGDDPGTAADWNLVGVFSIGKPIGRRCMEKVGAELIVTTQNGAVPLSVMLPIDQVGARGKALSDNIQNDFLRDARQYGATFGWQSLHYPQGSYALFNVPISSTKAIQYVVNTQTGAWGKFKNQDAFCWSLYNGDLYFGGAGGIVYKADTGTNDDGGNIDWRIKPAFNYFGSRGVNKLFSMIRPHFTSNGSPSFSIDLNVDFSNKTPTSIPTAATLTGAVWDTSKWDSAVWSDVTEIANWLTITGFGASASPIIRGGDVGYTISFTAWDMILQPGNAL
tara:strand:+ start:2317 stop:3828 length:1512 start_codon:yes stop_codon:yes gene_type:complete